MEFGNAEQMLLSIMRKAVCEENVSFPDASAEDWEALIKLSLQHKLLPMVLDGVYSESSFQKLPKYAEYKKTAKAQLVAQSLKTSEFSELYQKFRAESVNPLAVKGLLCASVYPDPSLRLSNDEDLYVSNADFAKVSEVLQNFGMYPMSEEADSYEMGWRKKNSPLFIELHRSLFSPTTAAVNSLQSYFSDAFGRTREYQTENGKIRSLTPHDHLLYLIFHAYKHFIHSGFGLRQICDIGLWARAYFDEIDWALLYRQCNEAHALKFAAAIFAAAKKHLGIDIRLPNEWKEMQIDCEPLLKDALCAGIYGSADKSRVHSASVTLNAVSAEREKKRSSVLQTVFPSKDKLKGAYPILDKHPAALPLVWCARLWNYRKETKTDPQNRAGDSLKIAKERIKLLQYYDIIEG